MAKKYIHEFTIDESKWVHGTEEDCSGEYSALVVESTEEGCYGQRCCLGFLAHSCGVKIKDMLGSTNLRLLREVHGISTQKLSALMDIFNEDEVIPINDNDGMTLAERKKLVKAFFAKAGIKVNFIKGKPKKKAAK